MSRTLTILDLDEAVEQRLRARATQHGRSMEAEAREILTRSVAGEGLAKEGQVVTPQEQMKRALEAVTGVWKGRGSTEEMMRDLRGED